MTDAQFAIAVWFGSLGTLALVATTVELSQRYAGNLRHRMETRIRRLRA